MRGSVIKRILSRLLWFTAAVLAIPLILAAATREPRWYAWALPAGIAVVLAFGTSRLRTVGGAPTGGMRRREALLAVTLGWLVLVFFTALAYYLSVHFDDFASAFFESMSGFTTTGATVVANIEALPRSVLLMRSFSHWIGGMGIIVLSVAILPELSVGGMQLVDAESSGIESEKLAPRIASTARRLWGLYLAITLVETALLALGGLSLFDAGTHAMATIATGGFSTKNASIAAFDSVYVEAVITVFMFLSGLNFVLIYRAVFFRKPDRLLRSPEARLYTLLTVSACALITADVFFTGHYDTLPEAIRYSTFQTVSIITTTGFGTADFDAWPHFSRLMLVGLMLIGGCAGSTAGGSKVVRLLVVMKHAVIQLRKLIRPRLVQTLQLGDRDVPRETTESVLGFYWLYLVSIITGSLVMTALGLDLVSGATASISAMNSIGPGLGSVGATQNFGHVPDVGKYALSFGMLLGRLEIYTVLVLFVPRFWRSR